MGQKVSTKIATILFFVIIIAILLSIFMTWEKGILISKKEYYQIYAAQTLTKIAKLQEKLREQNSKKDGQHNYADTFEELIKSTTLSEGKDAKELKYALTATDGYTYELVNKNTGWEAQAIPLAPEKGDEVFFFVDQTKIVRYGTGKRATSNSKVWVRFTLH